MPLRMVQDRGRNRPQIFCDHCGGRIEEANDGNYLWPMPIDKADDPQPIVFAHKQCTTAVEATRDELWGAIEIHELPVRLAANLAMPVEAKRGEVYVEYVLRGRILDLDLL